MSFVHGTDERIIVAKNLSAYRRNLVEDARTARAELMRGIWAHRDAAELEPLRVGVEVIDRKIAEVDRMVREGR